MRIADEPESVLTVQVDETGGDFFIRNEVRVVFVRTWFADRGWGVYERAWVCPVPRAMLADPTVDLPSVLGQMADLNIRPWAYTDCPSWPVFVLFPTVERCVWWWRHSRLARWWWIQKLRRRWR